MHIKIKKQGKRHRYIKTTSYGEVTTYVVDFFSCCVTQTLRMPNMAEKVIGSGANSIFPLIYFTPPTCLNKLVFVTGRHFMSTIMFYKCQQQHAIAFEASERYLRGANLKWPLHLWNNAHVLKLR